MKAYKPSFTDKTGKTKTCQHWYLTFTDNRGARRRLPAYSSKGATEKLGAKIEELLSCSGIISPELQRWIENLPSRMRDNLIKCGVIDSRGISTHLGKTLSEHLEDFCGALLARGNNPDYIISVKSMMKSIFEGCNFKVWTDMDANKLYTYLHGLTGTEGIGQRTFNSYLNASKEFCRWMVKERRSTTNPIDHLSNITQTEKRRKRRALTLDEQRKLLETTENSITHHNMTGHERALVYRLALQTGLRANEIRNLTVSSFDFTEGTVTLTGAYTKNKKTAIIDLKPETAAELKTFLANKLPTVKAFAMPNQPSKMIKKDLAATGKKDDNGKVIVKAIPYKTEEGTADFHSLRHSFITNLARSGVQPYEAQALARHSSITLTMNLYTHTKRESLREIIRNQPDLTTAKKNLSVA